MNLMIDQFIK